ncbi:MAG: SURF1 family protein, partial [Acidimicrobiia bacterium]|nr:SURF1 family protein [Acidimicrobiia bacterium]
MGALVKPRWIVGHLLAITAIVGFVRLGAWQLDRHGEKIELREAVEHGQMLPVVPLDSAEDGSYRRVTASGSYDSELQALVLRSHDGRSGYHVLTPLRGAGGGVV